MRCWPLCNFRSLLLLLAWDVKVRNHQFSNLLILLLHFSLGLALGAFFLALNPGIWGITDFCSGAQKTRMSSEKSMGSQTWASLFPLFIPPQCSHINEKPYEPRHLFVKGLFRGSYPFCLKGNERGNIGEIVISSVNGLRSPLEGLISRLN